jgi:hypothetical protein
LCYGTGQKSDMKSGSGSSKAGQAAYKLWASDS